MKPLFTCILLCFLTSCASKVNEKAIFSSRKKLDANSAIATKDLSANVNSDHNSNYHSRDYYDYYTKANVDESIDVNYIVQNKLNQKQKPKNNPVVEDVITNITEDSDKENKDFAFNNEAIVNMEQNDIQKEIAEKKIIVQNDVAVDIISEIEVQKIDDKKKEEENSQQLLEVVELPEQKKQSTDVSVELGRDALEEEPQISQEEDEDNNTDNDIEEIKPVNSINESDNNIYSTKVSNDSFIYVKKILNKIIYKIKSLV